ETAERKSSAGRCRSRVLPASAGRSSRMRIVPPRTEADRERLADRHPAHPTGLEDLREPLALVSLQDDGRVLDGTAAAEAALTGGEPVVELPDRETELLDHRHLLAAAALALEPDHGSCRTLRGGRRGSLRTAGQISELVLERPERVVKGLLL